MILSLVDVKLLKCIKSLILTFAMVELGLDMTFDETPNWTVASDIDFLSWIISTGEKELK